MLDSERTTNVSTVPMPMLDSGRPVPETVADYPDYYAGANLVRSLKHKGREELAGNDEEAAR